MFRDLSLYEKVKNIIKNGGKVLLYGPPGVGKTYLSNLVSNDLGLEIVEINSSETRDKEYLEYILSLSQTFSFKKKILIFEESDGIKNWKIVSKILDKSMYPIIFNCNYIEKIPDNIKNKFDLVERIKSPSKKEVVKILKNEGIDNIDNITTDIRASKISFTYGMTPYESDDFYKNLENLLLGKRFEYKKYMEYYVLENIENIYRNNLDIFNTIIFISNIRNYSKYLKYIKKVNKKIFFEKPKIFERVG